MVVHVTGRTDRVQSLGDEEVWLRVRTPWPRVWPSVHFMSYPPPSPFHHIYRSLFLLVVLKSTKARKTNTTFFLSLLASCRVCNIKSIERVSNKKVCTKMRVVSMPSFTQDSELGERVTSLHKGDQNATF